MQSVGTREMICVRTAIEALTLLRFLVLARNNGVGMQSVWIYSFIFIFSRMKLMSCCFS